MAGILISRDRSRPWSTVRLGCGLFGVVLAVCGALLFRVASPSPHGYMEIFFAIPLIIAGAFLTGLGVALQGKPFGWLVRGVGWVLLVSSTVLAILLAWSFR